MRGASAGYPVFCDAAVAEGYYRYWTAISMNTCAVLCQNLMRVSDY
jgi:hypothetical protein